VAIRQELDALWAELEEAWDRYRNFSFSAPPPEKPFGEHWRLKMERINRVYLGMSTGTVMLLRIRDFLLRRNVAFLPYLCEMLSMAVWRVSIGRKVTIGPGVIFPHGQVIIDGEVVIGRNCSINPWVTIGLSGRRVHGFDVRGPIIEDDVFIGTGAKVLGPITVGRGARIGANAVVIDDVPAGATVVGVPARVVHTSQVSWAEVDEYVRAVRDLEEKRQQEEEPV
jgi:serine O-acetyltransferase